MGRYTSCSLCFFLEARPAGSSAASKKWCCSEADECSENDCSPPSEIPCSVWEEITSESLPFSHDQQTVSHPFVFLVFLLFQIKQHWWKKNDGLWGFTNAVVCLGLGATSKHWFCSPSPSQAPCLQPLPIKPPEPRLLPWQRPCRRPSEGSVPCSWLDRGDQVIKTLMDASQRGTDISAGSVLFQSPTPRNACGGLRLTRGRRRNRVGGRLKMWTRKIKGEASYRM